MQSYDTTWLVWLANHVVSHVAPMRLSALSACLSILSTADNSTNNVSLLIQRMSRILSHHPFSHCPLFSISYYTYFILSYRKLALSYLFEFESHLIFESKNAQHKYWAFAFNFNWNLKLRPPGYEFQSCGSHLWRKNFANKLTRWSTIHWGY